jgi:hypothetical protein
MDPHAASAPAARRRLEPVTVWIGYGLALAFFIVESAEPPDLASRVTLIPQLIWYSSIVFWYYCVYRMHRELARATAGLYPISARKAVGFQLIPFFNVYWLFKWTNTFARFVNTRAQSAQMIRFWAGSVILLGLLTGQKLDGGVGILMLFGTMHYLLRELDWVTTLTADGYTQLERLRERRAQRRIVAFDAGLGAGFGVVFLQAAVHLWGLPPADRIRFGIIVLIVLAGVVRFVDRIVEHMRKAAGLPPGHAHTRLTRVAAIMAPVLTLFVGFSHAMLHHQVDQNVSAVLGLLFTTLLTAGVISYAWLLGVERGPGRSALYGAATGQALGTFLMLIFWVLSDGQLPISMEIERVELAAVRFADAWPVMLVNGLGWALLGLIGGFTLDRRLTTRPAVVAAGALVVLAVVQSVLISLARPELSDLTASIEPALPVDSRGLVAVLGGHAIELARTIGWAAGFALSTPVDALIRPGTP